MSSGTGGFKTPGFSVETGAFQDCSQGKSLLSQRRDEVWRGNLGELSPDSRELFDDIEEAENSSALGSNSNRLGCAKIGQTFNVFADDSRCEDHQYKDEARDSASGSLGETIARASSKKALNFDTPASDSSASSAASSMMSGGGLLDSHASQIPRRQRPTYATPSSLGADDRGGRSGTFALQGSAAGALSFSASSSAASISRPVARGIQGGQRLSFSSAARPPRDISDRERRTSSGGVLTETAARNQDDEQAQREATLPANSDTAALNRSTDSLHSRTTPRSSLGDNMDESERLARQLMAEEESQLLERMHLMQQAELQRMNEETSAQTYQSTDETNADSQSASDVAFALRLLEEEEEQARLAMTQAQQLVDNIGADGQVDPDAMTYEELLEIGERLGDVATERWRVDGREAVAALEVIVFNEETRDSEKLASVGEFKCLVCQYDYENGEDLKLLPCGHAFHLECIDPWLRDHHTCVTCKASIRAEEE